MRGLWTETIWYMAVALALIAQPSVSKPLIDTSRETHMSVCLDYSETAERLIEICRIALDQAGASPAQLIGALDSLGHALLESDRFSEASDVFHQMTDASIDDPRGWTGLGWVNHGLGKYAAAESYFAEALERAAVASALAGLTSSQWEQGGMSDEEAILSFEAALAIDPDLVWAQREIGWVLIEASQFEDAETVFTTILDATPSDTNARAGLVRALVRQDEYERALLQVERGLSDGSGVYWFLSQRSGILYLMGNYKQSLRDADRLIALDPARSEGHVRKARALVALGQGTTALGLLADVETQIGRDGYLTYWRAELHLDQDQPKQALALLKKNTSTVHADLYDLKLLARIQLSLNDLEGARTAVDRAKALRSDDAMTLYYDAVVMLRKDGAVTPALDRFDAAMSSGLAHDMIGDFAGELYRAGFLAHAIAIRAMYSDGANDQLSPGRAKGNVSRTTE